MKLLSTSLIFILLLQQSVSFGQESTNGSAYKITYASIRNGEPVSKSEFTIQYADGVTFLSKTEDKIRNFIDYNHRQTTTIIEFENELYKTQIDFDSLPAPTFSDQEETILGYHCKYATFFSFSNKIEVWYSNDSGAKGSPYSAYLPTTDALVLKVSINGTRTIVAQKIEKIDESRLPDYPYDEAEEISASKMEELKIKSRYTTIKVFEDEIINFDPSIEIPLEEDLVADKTFHFSKGSVILKKIKLPEVWEKGSQVFAKLTSWSNGDAYDRTGSIFILPASSPKTSMLDALLKGLDQLPVFTDNEDSNYQGIISTPEYETPIEIMRFFTSFGIRHFNTRRVIENYPWEIEATYKEEVTNLIPSNQHDIWLGVFIGNYDKGGHKVDLELDFYPSFGDESDNHWVQPLFYTVNIMEMSGQNYGRLFRNDTLSVAFDVPAGIEGLQLLYTTTGHGGWGGGDEFNQKLNQIFIDGEEVFQLIPWRTDCATYRLYNPASGNFGNGISSSDLSRSNWCPATLTPPEVIPLPDLAAGKHILKVVIDQGEDEGNSFNHWSVSGILTGKNTLPLAE
ncbi:PNGase F N-terminal domain-containing protein [Sunxiuqinia sp. A32]|uniref:PNGase F N-terminal domain-containing protein n=1 Tax=Sunxiuqinia sp. A32 TaxID=3461496 RepID=UPI0040468474